MKDLDFELARLDGICFSQLLCNYCEYKKHTYSKISLEIYLDYFEKALQRMRGN